MTNIFFWCHVRHVNSIKIHPEKIRQTNEEVVKDLDYDSIGFPATEKYFSKIETKTTFALMCLATKIDWFFQSTFQIKNLKTE